MAYFMLLKNHKREENANDEYLSSFKEIKMDLFSKLKEMNVLLIDDDEWIRGSMSLFFEGEECHLVALETAEEGMEAIKRQAYDIIIADYRLPGMDGLEFLSCVKESNPEAMKILITAYRSDEVVGEAIKMGINF